MFLLDGVSWCFSSCLTVQVDWIKKMSYPLELGSDCPVMSRSSSFRPTLLITHWDHIGISLVCKSWTLPAAVGTSFIIANDSSCFIISQHHTLNFWVFSRFGWEKSLLGTLEYQMVNSPWFLKECWKTLVLSWWFSLDGTEELNLALQGLLQNLGSRHPWTLQAFWKNPEVKSIDVQG